MLILTGGEERTNGEYGQLLAEAGLNLAKVQRITLLTASSRQSRHDHDA